MAMIDPRSYARLKVLVRDLAGIDLKPGKEALVAGRLQKRMRELQMVDFNQYLDHLGGAEVTDEIVLLLDALSTNVTAFFREAEHFALLRSMTATWIAEGRSELRVWCAACSTGEEPYTLAMSMLEVIGNQPVRVKMLATDISTRVLDIARHGAYSASAVAAIPETLLGRYFTYDAGKQLYRVSREMRQMITFNRVNLAKPPYPMNGPFDVVFCRNVMIYFDNEIRARILAETRRILRPGGLLCVGHAESLSQLQGDLIAIQPAAYRRP
jgi:chemotaxis protein methyltransferase CheR